jgi:hypothetical protein
MTRSKLIPIAALLATAWFAVSTLPAGAQQPAAGNAPKAAPPGAGPAGGPPAGSQSPEGQTPEEGPPWPVIMVTSVEVLHSERSGGMDILRARGIVTSSAWNTPHLVPITQGKALDGVLDVMFLATAPVSPEPLGPFMEVEALLPIGHGHPYKAVRVRSATNAITVKEVPGFNQAAAPKNDCSTCVGKHFVAKGQMLPPGVAAEEIVREEDLPWNLRVIGPSHGIPGYAVDPNRLTLVLSEDGRIVDAAWD